MSDREGYDELLADLKYLGEDDSVAEQQKKSIIEGQLVSSSEAAWDAMSPKLRCADDLMKLQLSGPEVAQIELCRGNGAPVSLAALPPHCGRTFPTYGGLVYATPYDGCGVMQQGGNYMVQVQWQGNSAVISCPVISTTTNETFLGPHPPAYLQILLPPSPPDTQSSAADTTPEPSTPETERVNSLTGEQPKPTYQEVLKPQHHGYPQAFPERFWPYYFSRYHYPGKVYPTAKPTESAAQAPTQKPQLPGYPQVFWPFYHNGKPKPPEKPVPTSIPTTSVAQAPTPKPELPGYPQEFWPYYYPHYHHGNPKPTENPVPTSIPTKSVAQPRTQKPQLPGYPQAFWPYYYHGKTKPPDNPVPTSIPTTSVAQPQTQKPQLPGYPQAFWPYYYHGNPKPPDNPVPTSIPTTSVAQAPTQKLQLLRYPQLFWPYYYPHYHHGKPKPSKKPAPVIPTTSRSSSPTTTQKQPPMYPGKIFPQYNYYPNYPLYFQEFYPQYPVQPPKTPTTAAECKPSGNQPPNEPPYVYIPSSSRLYEKDPFALQFVDFSELADSFP
ncbi:hypothetical protein ABG768_013214 [Culter alburnus]|uniref:Uncharacterized protein n=1 Tax=Culter alburnus TaxID=194366 RepID=A0AAW2B1D6_CULAL